MATKLTETRHLYSWWWDSHISPKNSKWLQENLTDIDGMVKAMIKIINEDADSFAKRAEMYYKKRPELMKLVEDFYRAYRSLAERYDHATGELRLAHRTMIEAFPNQMPFILGDESPENFDSDVGFSRKGLKQLHEMFQSGEATLRELKTAEGRLRGSTQGEEDVKSLLSEKNHGVDLRTMIMNESERAAKVEAEMQRLKQALAKMEAERDSAFAQYNQILEKLSNLEKKLCSAQADVKELEKSATDAQSEVIVLKSSLQNLKQEVSRSEVEKQDAIAHCQQSLDKISALEGRLRVAEENAERLSEQNMHSASEIKALKEEILRLNKEKEDEYLRYQQCLEMILKLQIELKGAEDQYALLEEVNQSLKVEANDLVQEITAKDQQLLDKNTELEKLMSRLRNEESRFMQVEATFQALQNMHFQSQEEQRGLAAELRDGIRMLKDLELCKRDMEQEIRGLREENRGLNDLKLDSSSAENEILGLNEIKEKLEAEVTRQAEQNEVLQQQLKQISDPEKTEKTALLKRLKDMEGIVQKSVVLESSLSDVKFELESSKEKMKALQEFCNSLSGEKSNLIAEKSALLSQLQIITESMQKILEKNVSLETALHSAYVELEGLRMKSKGLEEFCQFLKDEKSNLQHERSNLVYRLECVEKKLEKLETRFKKIEDRYAGLEKERDLARNHVEELRISLVLEKKELKCLVLSSEARLSGLENRVHRFQEENRSGKKEFEEQLEKAVSAQVEIFILKKFMKDVEERDNTLLAECHKHEEAAKYTDKLISELESENMMQHLETEYLLHIVDNLRRGIFQVLMVHEIDHVSETDPEIFLPRVRANVIEMKEENQELLIQNNVLSVVIKELSSEGVELKAHKEAACNAFFCPNQQLVMLQHNKDELLERGRQLEIVVAKKEKVQETLKEQTASFGSKQEALEKKYVSLQIQHSDVQDKLTHLEEEKHMLEDENSAAIVEALSLSNQSVVFKNSWIQTVTELEKAAQEMCHLRKGNSDLENHARTLGEKLAMRESENIQLKDSIQQLEEKNLEQQKNKEKDIVLLREANASLENEVNGLTQEIEACKIREVVLNSELQERSSEFELWEAEATSFYFDLQISSVHEALLENKVQELSGLCEDLQNADSRRSMEFERMKNRISFLESDREGLKSKLAEYVPVIASLKDNIASLEQTPTLQTKVADFMVDENQSKSTNAKKQNSSVSDCLSELQELQRRIKAIKRVLVVEKNSVQESIQTNIKIEETTPATKTKQLAKQRSRNNSQTELRNGIHMKDIPLDHVSASPPPIRRRKSSRLSDQMLDLWEVSPRRKRTDSIGDEIEKKELTESKQGGNRKIILERLASDAQKLTTLQISVQELRRKMEMNKKSKAAKDIEFKTLKSQIYNVESSVVQLVSMNTELTKTVRGNSSSLDCGRSRELIEVEQALRRKMLEQTRRDSERIGSLQMEMQKMESMLIKMEEEKNDSSKGGKNGLMRSRTGIILREFVYDRSRSRKQKKPRFCGCIRQSHKEV